MKVFSACARVFQAVISAVVNHCPFRPVELELLFVGSSYEFGRVDNTIADRCVGQHFSMADMALVESGHLMNPSYQRKPAGGDDVSQVMGYRRAAQDYLGSLKLGEPLGQPGDGLIGTGGNFV